MPEERVEVGALARDVSVQVATQVANSVATTKTNELLEASASAEAGRVSAENGRVLAEQGRVSAEQGRVLAEQGRVAAESARQAEIDSKITFGASVKDATLTAGYAELAKNLDSKMTIPDQVAYSFRTTAGAEEVADSCKVKSIVGGTIVWSQGCKYLSESAGTYDNGAVTVSFENNKIKVVVSGVRTNPVNLYIGPNFQRVNGHVRFFTFGASANAIPFITYGSGKGVFVPCGNPSGSGWFWNNDNIGKDTVTGASSFNLALGTNLTEGTYYFQPQMFDLTAMFGSTIADYIYSLEQANAGAGVAWFRRYFPKQYYAYSAPTPIHVKISGKKITRFNQFAGNSESNPQYIGHYFIDNYGNKSAESNYNCFRVRVLPNTSYCICREDGATLSTIANKRFVDSEYAFVSNNITGWDGAKGVFTTPSGCMYLEFSLPKTLAIGVNLNLHWDGERDGEYEEYYSNTYPIEDVELKGYPLIDAQGNLYFDGDEYHNDGTVDEMFGIKDFSALAFGYDSTRQYFYASISDIKSSSVSDVAKLICSKYVFGGFATDASMADAPDKSIYVDGTYIKIKDNSLSSSDTPTGVIIYQLATPTQSSAAPFTEIQEDDNWGTEELIDAHTGDVAVPAGHRTDYLPDLKAKVESAPSNPDSDGDYFMHREDGVNTYAPLSTYLSAQGYKKASELPTIDALGGTLRQLLAVKESLDFDDTGYLDMGSQSWTATTNEFYIVDQDIKASTTKLLLTNGYKPVGSWSLLTGTDKSIYIDNNHVVWIHDSTYADATEFKAAMKGVLLAYENASE